MPETPAQVEIPKRALFKAAEVCDLAKVQPYVLRSWEAEFPDLGVAKAAGAPRVYRRSDVEQVLRIKHLLLVEGLTLAGARRKLEEQTAPVAGDAPVIEALIGENARERLTAVKRGLQSILELLTGAHGADEFRLAAPTVASASVARPVDAGRRGSRRRAARRRRRAADRRALPKRAASVRRKIGSSGRSVAWLSRLTGGQEIGSSNLPVPTIFSLRSNLVGPGSSGRRAALAATRLNSPRSTCRRFRRGVSFQHTHPIRRDMKCCEVPCLRHAVQTSLKAPA